MAAAYSAPLAILGFQRLVRVEALGLVAVEGPPVIGDGRVGAVAEFGLFGAGGQGGDDVVPGGAGVEGREGVLGEHALGLVDEAGEHGRKPSQRELAQLAQATNFKSRAAKKEGALDFAQVHAGSRTGSCPSGSAVPVWPGGLLP
jgi:hypothetical protein